MDPTRAGRLHRRDHGMRRQRRVTQAVVAGSVAVAAAFGWVFAQPATSSAETTQSTEQPSTGSSDTSNLQQSDQAPDVQSGGS